MTAGPIPERRLFLDANAEDAPEDFEHPVDDVFERKIGAQRFFIEIVQGDALLFGPVADVPGLQLAAGEGFELGVLFAEALFGFLTRRSSKKLLGAFAGVGHAVVEDQVGEIGEAEQASFLVAELENFCEQGTIVMRLGGAAEIEGAPDLLANRGVVEIGHQGEIAGALQREAPAGRALRFGGRAGGGDGRRRQTGKLDSRRRSASQALVESRTFSENFVVTSARATSISLRRALPAGRVGSMAFEGIDSFGEIALHRAGERARLGGGGVAFDRLPQSFVEGQAE